MKIGIVGNGVVGSATARAWMEWADIAVNDIARDRSTHTLGDVLESEVIFVCLPTPKKENGEADLTAVNEFFEELAGSSRCFALRSTMPIGGTTKLAKRFGLRNLVHNPEFLTARCAFVDAQTPARNIVGIPDWPRGNDCCDRLRRMLYHRFPGVPTYTMAAEESEAVKVFLNSFFAVKVAYFNEIRTLADHLGLNWETVMDGVMADGRIAHAHTRVPGPDGKFGFGGTCLPKDLANLVSTITKEGLLAAVTGAALMRNERDRQRKV